MMTFTLASLALEIEHKVSKKLTCQRTTFDKLVSMETLKVKKKKKPINKQ